MIAAVTAALAPRVRPGTELGVVFASPCGHLADVVLWHRGRVGDRRAAGRTVAMLRPDGQPVTLYDTTHGDSGALLASLSSRDVMIGDG